MNDVERVSALGRAHGLRVAVVESLTCGRLALSVGAGEGASTWFAGGIVAYLTDIKERVLGVDPGNDPCSADCAEQLAAGGLALFGADVCVSTTGVGGPDADNGHEPGTVFVGWASADGVGHRALSLVGDPEAVMAGTVDAALRMLAARVEQARPAA